MEKLESYNIKIVYSKRKSVGITVKDGTVTVRSPKGKSERELYGILEKHRRWLDNALLRDKIRSERNAVQDTQDEARLRREAKAYFTALCEQYAKIMGVTYNRISINGAKGRFGSCSSKGNINFSYRIMLYPEPAREYVAVHELCHLKEMNHSPAFYKLVEKYLPDYKERRKLLRISLK